MGLKNLEVTGFEIRHWVKSVYLKMMFGLESELFFLFFAL